jgi:phenylalanyl-tRNA synthetase alpha subunit
MLQYSNLDSVMGTSNRFKNEVSLKVFSKLSKVTMIAIIAMSIACIANAQTKPNTRQVEKIQKSENDMLNTEIEVLKAYIASEIIEKEHLQSSLEHLQAVHHSKKICKLMKKVEKYRQNAERRISNWEREIAYLEREKQRLEIAMRSE